MQFQQRQVEPFALKDVPPPWLHPQVTRTLVGWRVGEHIVTFEPEPSDWYVTVDERVGPVIGLVAAPWPMVDPTGVLLFTDRAETAWADADRLQQQVDEGREQTGQTARPLRVGDTFWVRTPTDEFTADQWTAMRDVTADARTAAKTAVAFVSVGTIDDPAGLFAADDRRTDDDRTDDDFDDRPQAPPPAGPGFASPAV